MGGEVEQSGPRNGATYEPLPSEDSRTNLPRRFTVHNDCRQAQATRSDHLHLAGVLTGEIMELSSKDLA